MRLLTPLLILGFLAGIASATPSDDGHRLVGLLDYIGADYPAAVRDGRVVDDFEYKEMQGLVAAARDLLSRGTPPADLRTAVDALAAGIEAKAEPAQIAGHARRARVIVVRHFGVTLAPAHAPDRARGAELYASACTSCHGARGAGDGPAAPGLKPAPANFTDPALLAGLSPYRAFNTTTFGVDGTSMRSREGR